MPKFEIHSLNSTEDFTWDLHWVTINGSHFQGAALEGTAEELIALARAIKNKEEFRAKRLAVSFTQAEVPGLVKFWSPRNSMEGQELTPEHAIQLAETIAQHFFGNQIVFRKN
jgi:hypothetical protein